MSTLVFKDGKLFFKNGKLSFCKDDCLCTDDSGCETCCTKLVGGEWVPETVDKTAHFAYRVDSIGSDDWLEVEIHGVASHRRICHGQEVKFVYRYVHFDAAGSDDGHGGAEPNHAPVITWDRAWTYDSSGPAIGASGETYPLGMVKWGDDQDIHEVEINLTFNACYVSSGTQYGAVNAYFYDDDFVSETTLTDCPNPNSVDCCISDYECDPCCYYVPVDSGEPSQAGDAIVYWAESEGVRVRLAIMVDPDSRVIFCRDDGGTMTIKVDVIPPPEYTAGHEPKFCLHWEGWWPGTVPAGTGDPPCPPPVDEDCDSNTWTKYGTGWSTSIEYATPACDHPCAQEADGGITLTLGLEGSAASEITIETDALEECPGVCCCGEYIPCCSPCFFPVDGILPASPMREVGGQSQIEGLEIDYASGATWWRVEQRDTSEHAYHPETVNLPLCPEKIIAASNCGWHVPVTITGSDPGLPVDTFVGVYGPGVEGGPGTGTAENPVLTGNWLVRVEHVLIGNIGLSSSSSDCTGTLDLSEGDYSGLFKAIGGKAYPDGWSCSDFQGGLLMMPDGEGGTRLATTNDLPPGFFNSEEF